MARSKAASNKSASKKPAPSRRRGGATPIEKAASPAAAAPQRKLDDHLINVRTIGEFRPGVARGAGPDPSVPIDAHREDLVEVELESGARFFTRFDQFVADFGGGPARGGAQEGQFVIPAKLVGPTAERGVGEWAIKTLRLLGIDPVGSAATLTGVAVCTWYERKQLHAASAGEDGAQQLWRVVPGNVFDLAPTGAIAAGESPLLILLHGTASSTRGSFGELWAPNAADVRRALLDPYEDRVYAYEHFSLTQSPMQNALQLVDALPRGARLHLVSHSRGGLVGELLCRAQMVDRDPFEEDEIAHLFADPQHADEADQLHRLNAKLKEKALRVERFARVACPARGTVLVSGRIDRWLSVMLDVVGGVADLATSGFFAVFEEFVKAFVRTRTDPQALPGLEAMMPTSPIIQLLNRSDVRTSADLHVVAGDIEGGDVVRRLGILLTDLYYREDHDLVVNTRAMYGGTPRVAAPRRFFARGPQVYHFTYFKNSATASKVADALHKPLLQDGFELFDQRDSAPPARGYRIPAPAARGDVTLAKPIVMVLPGIMGSCLDAGGERVWVDIGAINKGGMERLAIDADKVKPTALVDKAYDAFLRFMERTHEVVPFPFDWRLSLRDEARRLAEAVKNWLDEADRRGQPLVLVAHSLGGLLARVMIADFPQLWARIVAKPHGRLVMLGTPNGGSHSIPLMLIGREPLVQGLGLVDFRHSQRELLQMVARFPGVLELLPARDAFDFFDPDIWKKLHLLDDTGNVFWEAPDAAALENSRAVREILDRSTPNLDRLVYVAGRAPSTPWLLRLDNPPSPHGGGDVSAAGAHFYFEATAEGDGRVPWSTGILPGLRPWYMDAVHGDLASTEEHFDALLDLITSGTTDKLPTTQPEVAKRDAGREVFHPPSMPYVPDADDLQAAAMGGGRRRKPAVLPGKAVRAAVAHGNLLFSRHVVFVGHYQGDAIISAESVIDGRLGSRLSASHALGLYPGALNTAKVFLNRPRDVEPGPDFPGAVVVGLDEVGELSPAMLTSTLTHAAITYAVERAEAEPAQNEPGELRLQAATLLIGTGWNAMPVRDSVLAIMRAVVRANDELGRSRYKDQARYDEIAILELYEDVAIEAAHALRLADSDPELAGRIEANPRLQALEGGRTRASYADQGEWWHRLQIIGQKNGALKFTMLTDRARAETTLQPTQRALVGNFIAQQISSTQANDRIAATLFELLIPNRLKDRAPEGRDLMLLVDGDAASYPWEMMQDGFGAADAGTRARTDPARSRLALRAGLIRQLRTEEFRQVVTNASDRHALVVGNPKCNPEIFPDLPGARDEAAAVAQALRDAGEEVTEMFDPQPDAGDIIEKLFARPYRILHLAGHGVFDFEMPFDAEQKRRETAGKKVERRRVTGMVIGDGIFLTPAEVQQMRLVPEIVFVNCCHLGRITAAEDAGNRDRHRLAANLSTELIRMGVKVVVAAGWAVDDAAAKCFATTFYRQMLAGIPFGRAVHAARLRTAADHPQCNTWGAYQCYGDYAFRLKTTLGSSAGGKTFNFAAPAELVIALHNIASDALTATPEKVERLKKEVDALIRFVQGDRGEWLAMGRVRAALANALGELDRFDEALAHYAKALEASRADFPVRAVEQCANLMTRAAVARARTQSGVPGARAEASRRIEEAKVLMERLLDVGQTPERLSIMGAAYKRQAMVSDDAGEQAGALARMCDFYRRAHELAFRRQGRIDAYPLLNWVAAELCLAPAGVTEQKRRELDALLERVAQGLAEEGVPDFWSLVASTDLRMVRALLHEEFDAAIRQRIVADYQWAHLRAGSPRQMRSVMEHADFMAQMYTRSAAPAVVAIANELGLCATDLRSVFARKAGGAAVPNPQPQAGAKAGRRAGPKATGVTKSAKTATGRPTGKSASGKRTRSSVRRRGT